MKITVIGSTGRTGMHVLEQGIRRGHELTAFTRRPQLLENITGLNNIVAGDALHVSHLKKAIENQEAVIAIVGDRQTPVASESTKCLIQAMQECNVHRLVCVSSYLLGSTRQRGITQFFQWLLRHSLSDRLSADQLIISSKTDWTIVRATRLHDKPATGNVRLQKSGLEFESGPYGICRADLASVLLDTVTNKASINSIINATWGRNK